MDTAVPLLVALAGAMVGAYFAVLKSQRERLWFDRYETLRDIVLCLGTVEYHFASSHMSQLGVRVMGGAETKKLAEEWPEAMHMLRRHVSKLRLLFKDSQIAELRAAIERLYSSFTDMYHSEQIHQPELHEAVASSASEAEKQAINVAQKYYL